MTTSLTPIADDVNLLTLDGIRYRDLEAVNAWLYACSIQPCERHDICCCLMLQGEYSFCNIEYRLEVNCKKQY